MAAKAPGHLPIPWALVARLAVAMMCRRKVSFRQEARRCLQETRLPLKVLGTENIPKSGPILITVNHYTRPGLGAWWMALTISAVAPVEIHWISSAAWTFPDRLRSKTITPLTRWLFRKIAQVYDFTVMPPMPPDPADIDSRTHAVREVIEYARTVGQPVIGLAPEGRDSPDGGLQSPPPGAGRFMLQLAKLGLPVLPVGFYEAENLHLSFGPSFSLEQLPGIPVDEKDRFTSQVVMHQIAALLPEELRGSYALVELSTGTLQVQT